MCQYYLLYLHWLIDDIKWIVNPIYGRTLLCTLVALLIITVEHYSFTVSVRPTVVTHRWTLCVSIFVLIVSFLFIFRRNFVTNSSSHLYESLAIGIFRSLGYNSATEVVPLLLLNLVISPTERKLFCRYSMITSFIPLGSRNVSSPGYSLDDFVLLAWIFPADFAFRPIDVLSSS